MGKDNIEKFIYKLNNPQVYSGMEINVAKSDFKKDKINICLVFPDIYDIGMSHQGIKILYHLLDRIKYVNVERCFLPDKESMNLFKIEGVKLFSLESRTPLKDFDLIGFSVLSEMSYTNILQVLELSAIPLRSIERGNNHPLIVTGGITAAANPEPMREFIDIFAIGDGEILFPEIIKKLKIEKKNRKKDLKIYSKISGLYIPSMYTVKSDGKFTCPDTGGNTITKRILRDINTNPFPDGLIVPITNVIFDRLEVEIGRGCPQNCRFCQAKAYYSPFRIKNPSEIKKQLLQSLVHTGFESFSLSSLSSGDHPDIEKILDDIIKMKPQCLSLSLPSLRPSTLSGHMLSTLSMGRKTGITIVPEAGSERLRQVINKEVSDEDILSSVRSALAYGWQKIKLYFMIGLPTENEDDLKTTIELIEKIINESKKAKKNLRIHISFSPFVPKPHTVFQWAKRDSSADIYRKIEILKNGLKKYRNIDLDFHRPEKGVVETILSRGDHKVGELIYRAFRAGEIFSAWDSEFNFEIWEELIEELGLSKYLEEIDTDEPLPWSYLDFNFKQDFLINEYKKALDEEITPSCTDMKCSICNGCNFKYQKIPKAAGITERSNPSSPVKREFNKVRIFYKKTGSFTWFSHLPTMRYIERLIRKAGIRFRCTEGFHPRIKMSSIPPLPVFAKGMDEVVELFIENDLTGAQILESLNRVSGDFIFNSVEIVNHKKNLNKDLKHIVFRIEDKDMNSFREKIEAELSENDKAVFRKDYLDLKIDFSDRGAERFAKIYKITDPYKKKTKNLTRRRIAFKD